MVILLLPASSNENSCATLSPNLNRLRPESSAALRAVASPSSKWTAANLLASSVILILSSGVSFLLDISCLDCFTYFSRRIWMVSLIKCFCLSVATILASHFGCLRHII